VVRITGKERRDETMSNKNKRERERERERERKREKEGTEHGAARFDSAVDEFAITVQIIIPLPFTWIDTSFRIYILRGYDPSKPTYRVIPELTQAKQNDREMENCEGE
jgi:hypothetical protein